MLYFRGIKVLSLFFIDEVAKYKQYDASGTSVQRQLCGSIRGEYNDIVSSLQLKIGEDAYISYLKSITADKNTCGIFLHRQKEESVRGRKKWKEVPGCGRAWTPMPMT
jgi:type III restriction enzyme